MIEINLSPSQTKQDFTKLGPFNLSLINPIYLLVAIVLVYMVEGVVKDYFQPEIEAAEKSFQLDRKKLSLLQDELKRYANIKAQVEELNRKEVELAKQIDVIKKIVDKRQNPFLVLKYIADKTPADVWLREVEIDDKAVRLQGFSKDWSSIGKFIEELKQSIHFNGNVNFTRPLNVDSTYNEVRVETFELKTTVSNFYGE